MGYMPGWCAVPESARDRQARRTALDRATQARKEAARAFAEKKRRAWDLQRRSFARARGALC